ncbi:MAG: pirin family protein [Pseudomonadota bacterium]
MEKHSIDTVIRPRERDLGDFTVRRVLPHGARAMVGPFIFFDHMGPAVFPAGKGIDVRPHPHINLATVTYLFEGSLFHRDSVGATQNIEPGAVNWMTAGRGITHSERSDHASRTAESRIHGIQSWLALPVEHEEVAPSFVHHPADTLPAWRDESLSFRLIAGEMAGHTAPVDTLWPMFYADCHAEGAGSVTLEDRFDDRAAYVVTGGVTIDGQRFGEGEMIIFTASAPVTMTVEAGARVMLLGGDPMPEQRHIWWNFVSSRLDRIETAKQDWANQRFDQVPGEDEFIPLPE